MENREIGSLRFIIITTCIVLTLCGIIAVPKKNMSKINKSKFYFAIMKWNIPFLNSTSLHKKEVFNADKKAQESILLQMLFLPLKMELPIFADIKALNLDDNKNKENTKKDMTTFFLDTGEFKKAEISTGMDKDNKVLNVYNPDLVWNEQSDSVQVLIYHTHTREGYLPGEKQTEDPAYSVLGVGDELFNELKNYGINVIHDRKYHDNNYDICYIESGKTLDEYMKEYGGFDLIIDLHRDSGPIKEAVTTKFNGKNLAKFMFVYAKNNPHYGENMKVVDELIKISKQLYPGLCRGELFYNNVIKNKAFNQDRSNNCILIELGADVNTIDEAKETTKYLARIIAEYLKEKTN